LNLLRNFAISALILPALISSAAADEGMWLFNQFPKDAVLDKYSFAVTSEFLDNMRLASARIPGGSASFVSPMGLLLTNQHLVSGCLAKASTPGHDYRKEGFYAATEAAEVKCDSLEASVLMSMEDVTAKVKAGATEKTPAAQSLGLRNAAIAKLEKECADKAGAGSSCSVVTLFSGGRYDLYRYKVYSDLRLVFAPETELAVFGHERDAVTYLRYGLDAAFLRAYEGGKPASTPHYFKWSAEPVKSGDLVFASGDPEVTSRTITAAELKYLRDAVLPLMVTRLQPLIQQVATFSAQSDANKQVAEYYLSGLLKQYKNDAGRLIGLRDDRMVNRKTNFENKVKRAVENDPKLGVNATKVWDDIQIAYRMWQPSEKAYEMLEGSPAPGSILFQIARGLARDGSIDPALESAPENDKVEVILLARYLEDLKVLADKGDKDVPVKALLNGKTPQQAAEAAIMGTALKDPAARAKLKGNMAAVKASTDPLLKMALLIDDPAKRLRKRYEDTIGSLETTAEDKIAGYRFKLFGASEPPDATGTPRVEFGVVKGYTDRAGTPSPFATSFGGLYFRTNNEGPYQVPQHWVDLKATLNLETPLDFVSTCDIGGGDYGSPVVNRAGHLVGVTFDGNLESMPDTYLYSDEQARAVSVSVQGIAQALDQAYKATALLAELGLSR
jgi:hypothetical protein